MSEIANKISAVANCGLWPFLKNEGFRRRDQHYYRSVGEALQVITLQSSQWNTGASGRFRVNFGVHFAALAKMMGAPKMPTVPKEHFCLLRGIWSVPERWWQVDSGSDVTGIARELEAYGRNTVWPWLQDNESLEQATLTWEQQPEGMGLWLAAAARLHLGERDEAECLIKQCIALSEKSLSRAHPANVDTAHAHLQRLRKWAAKNNLGSH